MKRENIIKAVLYSLLMVVLSACSVFFEPDNKTVLFGDDYMKETSEMYSGFVGLVTKIQTIGDKAIYLTDTRAEMLEPTGKSNELYALYNYETNLTGNSYADPAKYYDVIIACNDYLQKAYEYKTAHPGSVDMTHYKGLIGGTLRIKAWIYFTLAKIYGETVWFDDPMWKLKDYSQYPIKNLDETISACVDLLNTGFDGINASNSMSWTGWITSTEDAEANAGDYYYWDLMTPEYFALAAELALWQGRYQDVVNLILPKLNEAFAAGDLRSSTCNYMINLGYSSGFRKIFDNTYPEIFPTVSVIKYNYEKDQTNTLLKHFINDIMLRPAKVAVERYSDPEFNPLNENATDRRLGFYYHQDASQNWIFHKYRNVSGSPRSNPKQDDVHIYIYRSVELHLMLIEAFNHLGRFDEMNALLQGSVTTYFPDGGVTWEGFTDEWCKKTPRGQRQYEPYGIRPSKARELKPCDTDENIRHNDMEILKEIILEQPGEGKTYGAMLRMAKRYKDYNIIADLVCPKYEAGKKEEIRSKILNGGYFVHWDINSISSIH